MLPAARAATRAIVPSVTSERRLGVREDVRELVLLRLRIHHDEDAARDQRPEDRDDAGKRVVREHDDAVAALEPELLQRPGEALRRSRAARRTRAVARRRRGPPCRRPSRPQRARLSWRRRFSRMASGLRPPGTPARTATPGRCRRRRRASGRRSPRAVGLATRLSWRSMTEMVPTSPISSVSPTPRSPALSHLATRRATASGSNSPASRSRSAERRSRTYSGAAGPTNADAIGARYGRFFRRGDLRRDERGRDLAEQVLLLEPPHLEAVGKRRLRTRPLGSRGTGSGPRPSAPSASGLPASAGGSRRGTS